MIRLAISVEGRTEEEFVNNVLADHLRDRDVEPAPIPLGGDVTVERLASEGYVYLVPYVEQKGTRFLKTIIPSSSSERYLTASQSRASDD